MEYLTVRERRGMEHALAWAENPPGSKPEPMPEANGTPRSALFPSSSFSGFEGPIAPLPRSSSLLHNHSPFNNLRNGHHDEREQLGLVTALPRVHERYHEDISPEEQQWRATNPSSSPEHDAFRHPGLFDAFRWRARRTKCKKEASSVSSARISATSKMAQLVRRPNGSFPTHARDSETAKLPSELIGTQAYTEPGDDRVDRFRRSLEPRPGYEYEHMQTKSRVETILALRKIAPERPWPGPGWASLHTTQSHAVRKNPHGDELRSKRHAGCQLEAWYPKNGARREQGLDVASQLARISLRATTVTLYVFATQTTPGFSASIPPCLEVLERFSTLRSLCLADMIDSVQPALWEVIWRHDCLEELKLAMLLSPELEAPMCAIWRGIDSGWRQSTRPLQNIVYRGIDGRGIIHPELGFGEYLDTMAISYARTRVVQTHKQRSQFLRIRKLTLEGFIVDSTALLEWFDPALLLELQFGPHCLDAGIRLGHTAFAGLRFRLPAAASPAQYGVELQTRELRPVAIRQGRIANMSGPKQLRSRGANSDDQHVLREHLAQTR